MVTAPLYALALYAPSIAAGWLMFAVPYALSLAWLAPTINAVQNLVAPTLRATASAWFLLINNLIGIGFGTFIFGYMSDRLTPAYGGEALRLSLLFGLGFYLLAAVLYLLAAGRLRRDFYKPPAPTGS
jgi:MFS family permease